MFLPWAIITSSPGIITDFSCSGNGQCTSSRIKRPGNIFASVDSGITAVAAGRIANCYILTGTCCVVKAADIAPGIDLSALFGAVALGILRYHIHGAVRCMVSFVVGLTGTYRFRFRFLLMVMAQADVTVISAFTFTFHMTAFSRVLCMMITQAIRFCRITQNWEITQQ